MDGVAAVEAFRLKIKTRGLMKEKGTAGDYRQERSTVDCMTRDDKGGQHVEVGVRLHVICKVRIIGGHVGPVQTRPIWATPRMQSIYHTYRLHSEALPPATEANNPSVNSSNMATITQLSQNPE